MSGPSAVGRDQTVASEQAADLGGRTLIPSLASSPEILTHPHLGFSRAIRSASSTVSGSRAGRPVQPVRR